MSEAWIPLTLAAAFLQNLRSALQKHSKAELGTSGATLVRFAYGLPFALLYLAGIRWVGGEALPMAHWRFAAIACAGGLAQLVGSLLLVSLFDLRNFAVGTTYSKTEAVQAALFAILFLGEGVSLQGALGIGLSLLGVIAISAARTPAGLFGVARAWLERPAWIGLASGACFGVAAVCYRAASLSLDEGSVALRAAVTLSSVLAFQSVALGAYMLLRARAELAQCLRSWRIALAVGASGAAASVGWFTAMTLQNAALVRALGQVELVFTLGASVLFFRERILRFEALGIALVVAGLLVLLLR